MPNYKPLFKKNLLMMTILVFFIFIVILFINFLYDKKAPSITLGGSFILTDQDGKRFDSRKVNFKKLIYFQYNDFTLLYCYNFLKSYDYIFFCLNYFKTITVPNNLINIVII